mmetsp:Transcript_23393/g.66692  ORF Transcript_23393/g.66692 Transcript_23393/m.66692 type:complete len:204 (+) Transcript_23393:777-1388(+)
MLNVARQKKENIAGKTLIVLSTSMSTPDLFRFRGRSAPLPPSGGPPPPAPYQGPAAPGPGSMGTLSSGSLPDGVNAPLGAPCGCSGGPGGGPLAKTGGGVGGERKGSWARPAGSGGLSTGICEKEKSNCSLDVEAIGGCMGPDVTCNLADPYEGAPPSDTLEYSGMLCWLPRAGSGAARSAAWNEVGGPTVGSEADRNGPSVA